MVQSILDIVLEKTIKNFRKSGFLRFLLTRGIGNKNWGMQIAGMIFQTRFSVARYHICKKKVLQTSFCKRIRNSLNKL
ncbi:DUF6783 domain-containing protein [Anaerobutyricum hallii]|uniref:DUF6783 domain-containing protein n=1 Tax=Anaerobutyricum hallii TaxID=39488 RepID=UPI003FA48113